MEAHAQVDQIQSCADTCGWNRFVVSTKETRVSTTTLADSARRDLSGFGGELIGPSDPELRRRARRLQRDDRPVAGADRPLRVAADVVRAVDFARDHGALLAVRGGGHNGGGLGTCDDGMVIDLAPMKGVAIDEARRTVRVGGGARGPTSTTRTTPRAWRRRAASSRRPASAASRSAAASATSRARYGLTIDSLLVGRGRPGRRLDGDARARTRTPTCSGRSAAAAATSAS